MCARAISVMVALLPAVIHADMCQSEHGLQCSPPASDIGYNTGVWTSAQCCNNCQQHSGCNAWAWNFKHGHCHLHTSCDRIPNPDYHSGYSSGPPAPSPSPPPGPSPSHGRIQVLQWNPHYECFSNSNCKQGVYSDLDRVLRQYDVDFANIVELPNSFNPPSPLAKSYHSCGGGRDAVMLIYNSLRWTPLDGGVTGCMVGGNDRAFGVQRFKSKASGYQLVFAGAHYPHPWQGNDGALASQVKSALSRLPANSGMIFAADTNQDPDHSTTSIVRHLSGASNALGAPLHHTCCKDSNYKYEYDRVGSTFGRSISSQMLFDPAPSYTNVGKGEFHKAILATIDAGSVELFFDAVNASSSATLIV